MAYQTARTMAQLKLECRKLGIETPEPRGKKISKSDYVEALRDYHKHITYGGELPKTLDLMTQIESPMLCQRYQVLKPEEQQAIWESGNWYLEEKVDGARMILMHIGGSLDFYSRNLSVTDFYPISYRDNILVESVDVTKITDSFIVDSEVISSNPNVNTVLGSRGVLTETQLQAVSALLALNLEQSLELQRKEAPLKFMVFDVLYWNGEWITERPLRERRQYLREALKQLKAAGLQVSAPKANIKNKPQFHKAVMYEGGEGCVAKNLDSPYVATSSRRRDGWVKIKRSMSESLGDTVDGFITGFEPADEEKAWAGYVGALDVSVYLRNAEGQTKVHQIARVAGLTTEDRIRITETDSQGKPQLRKEFYGAVVTIDGQCVSARSKRLKHAVLVEWRPDRSPDTCIMDQDFLESMIL